MKYIGLLKKAIGYLFSMLLLSIVLNACNTPPGSPRAEREHKSATEPKKIIYILNALWPGMQEFNNLKNLLSIAFEKEGLNIEVKSLNTVPRATSEQSITQQANEALDKIKEEVSEEKHEIILIGHSQGGLRGAKILFLNEQDSSPLHIKGLITLGSPWEGAPAASITKTSVQSFLQTRKARFTLASATYVYPAAGQLDNGSINNFFDGYFPTHEPGVADMVPNSDFLRDLASNLADNSTPILAIAGNNGNVKEYIDYSANDIQPYSFYLKNMPSGWLNSSYARIFTGGWYTEHDMIVPLYSQLAENTTNKNKFKTYLVEGATHDFLPGLSIPSEIVIYNHKETIECIVKFSKLNFDFEEESELEEEEREKEKEKEEKHTCYVC